MRILRILIFCALGLAAGLMVLRAFDNGYPQRWSKLPLPPVPVLELLGSGYAPYLVRAADGVIYDYSAGDGWRPGTVRQYDGPQKSETCVAAFLRFALPDVRPNSLRQCLHLKGYYADGFLEYGVALDSAGAVWKWDRGQTPADLPNYFLVACCCPSFGVFMGWLVAWSWNKASDERRRAAHDA